MVFYFRYKQFTLSSGAKMAVPKIPVVLVGKQRRINVLGLVDSGSTQCTIPKEIAELLGLELKSKVDVDTVTGKTDGIESEMKLIIELPRERKEITVPVVVLEGLDEIILGRERFFDAFEIIFKERHRKVGLKPAKPNRGD